MTFLDTRRLIPLLGVLVGATLVVWGNAFRSSDDCARPRALLDVRLVPGSTAVSEQQDHYNQSIFQWTEGRIADSEVRFGLLRAAVPGDLTRSPIRLIRPHMIPDLSGFTPVDVDGETLPIHYRASIQAGTLRFASYAFVYDGRPVEDELPHQLATAGASLLRGGRPLTLLLTWGIVPAHRADRAREEAERWLADAWRYYARVCAPS